MAFFNVAQTEKVNTLTETFDRGFNTSVREADAAPTMFEGDVLGALGSGISSGFNRSKYNLYDSSPEGVSLKKKITESIIKMRPDPKTLGSAGQLMFGLAEPLAFIGTEFLQDPISTILSAPTLAMNVTKNFEPAQTAVNIADGMDAKTAADVARTTSIAMGAGSILPVSVAGKLATRIVTGGALNLAVGAGERAETGRILRSAGYEDMAKQYTALDGQAALAEFVLGGAFGGLFGGRARVRPAADAVLPSTVDAALTANQAVNATVDLAPGVPMNGRSAQAHSEALNSAIEQLAFGEKVNVANLLTEAGFLGNRPDFNATAIIREELQRAGFTDVAAQVRDLEAQAMSRGLYVEPSDLNVVLSDAPADIKVGGIKGREAQVKIGNDYVPVEYRIMESAEVSGTMGKADNQYRDRTRVASEQQISQAAADLDPRLLGDSPVMDYGAPVMTADGKIIAGNGRAAFIERAYETNVGQSYRDYLKENSDALGLNAAEIDGMTRPVLVRVLQRDVDVNKAAILSNEGGAMGMSALEQAKVDGERLGDFGAFQFGEDGSVSNVANMPFIRSWVEKFPTNQISRLMDADGRLSAEGNRRLQNAIMYRAYGDSATLSRLVEATDPGSRNIVAALSKTAARVADAKESIARGEMYPLDLSEDLLSAVEKIDSIKRSGQTVNSWVAQLDAFGDGMTGEARALVVMLDRNIRSARAISDAIDGYYARLEALGNPEQGSMFEAATPTKQDVFAPMLDAGEVQYSRAAFPVDALAEFGAFKTGQPVTFGFLHNTESATKLLGKPKKGDAYGRDLEPSGRYVVEGSPENVADNPKWIGGELTFDNPLVLNNETWKRDLNSHYKATGKKLSQAIIRDGYDGVVTVDKYGTSEILDLTTFDPGVAMYSRSQTETPEFKKWFGKSKVVDADKNPLVMYHGTNAEFDVFDYTRIGQQGRAEGAGFYFTNNKSVASGYGTPMEVFLSIEKPMPYDTKPLAKPVLSRLIQRVAEIESEKNGMSIGDGFLSNYGDVNYDGLPKVLREATNLIADDVTALDQISGIVGSGVEIDVVNRAMKEVTGYDGIVAKGFGNEGSDANTIYVAFFPEQIKSATNNSGAFDPANPSINYSRTLGTRSTVSDLTATFNAQFGRDASKLIEAARVSIVQSVSDLPARSDATPHPSDVGGMYDPRDGMTYIVADNTAPSQVRGRILHEIGVHAGFETMLGDAMYADVLAHVDAKIAAGDERFIKARALAEKNAARPEHVPQETLAYLVENAPESSFGRRILAAVRQWLYRVTGGRFVDLSVGDLVEMASASLRRQARIEGVAMGGDVPMYTRAQESTAEFQRWFGDSKVVDSEGKPLVVYHGGPKFDEFRVPDGEDRGIYFTDNEYFAQDVFALQTEIAARDKNNFDYADVPDDMASSGEWDAKYFKYAEVKPVYLKMNNPKIVESLDAKLIPSLYEQGFDGVIVKSTGDFGYKGAQYVVFDPSQIKSAIGNSGAFNPDNPSLTDRIQSVNDFYRNENNGAILSSNDNPLPTTMIPTGDIMEPIGLAAAKVDANIASADSMQPGFLSAVECALVAGE